MWFERNEKECGKQARFPPGNVKLVILYPKEEVEKNGNSTPLTQWKEEIYWVLVFFLFFFTVQNGKRANFSFWQWGQPVVHMKMPTYYKWHLELCFSKKKRLIWMCEVVQVLTFICSFRQSLEYVCAWSLIDLVHVLHWTNPSLVDYAKP